LDGFEATGEAEAVCPSEEDEGAEAGVKDEEALFVLVLLLLPAEPVRLVRGEVCC
jgi:hypothetical protein